MTYHSGAGEGTRTHYCAGINEDRNRSLGIVQLAAETTGSSSLNPSLRLRISLSMTDSLKRVVCFFFLNEHGRRREMEKRSWSRRRESEER